MPKIPYIKTLADFDDEVQYCFYIIGYIEGVRAEAKFYPDQQYKESYDEGYKEGERFVRWLLMSAVNNKN